MASGPDHYREAERLLGEVRKGYESGPTMSYQNETCTLAEAQVHATLALAAATAEPIAQQLGANPAEIQSAWSAAIS